MTELNIETLWRCETCGKWSHAKLCPRLHRRWETVDWDGDQSTDPNFIEWTESMEHDTGARETTGCFMWCGPFAQWKAVRSYAP